MTKLDICSVCQKMSINKIHSVHILILLFDHLILDFISVSVIYILHTVCDPYKTSHSKIVKFIGNTLSLKNIGCFESF